MLKNNLSTKFVIASFLPNIIVQPSDNQGNPPFSTPSIDNPIVETVIKEDAFFANSIKQ